MGGVVSAALPTLIACAYAATVKALKIQPARIMAAGLAALPMKYNQTRANATIPATVTPTGWTSYAPAKTKCRMPTPTKEYNSGAMILRASDLT